MSEEDSNRGDHDAVEGKRKDGRHFKEGNTCADGSYIVGKGRPPKAGQFRKGDGRKRGKRKKGSKNLDTIWEKKLNEQITHKGKRQSGAEWLVEGTLARGISRSDRAAEISLKAASQIQNKREGQHRNSDEQLIDAWLNQRIAEMHGSVSDDLDGLSDVPGDNPEVTDETQ